MNFKKVTLSGLAGGVVFFVIGNLFYYAFQGLYMTDAMAALWKEMPMPGWIIQLFVVNLVIGLLLAALYDVFGNTLEHTACKKGAIFGLLFGIFYALTHGLTEWLLFNIPTSMHVLGFVENLVAFAATGAAIAFVYEKV